MPSIEGLYSLTEVATKLSRSLTWINKVQRETGVAKKDIEPGKRASFTEAEIKMLNNVKLLRDLGFSFQDIKKIFDTEKRIIKVTGGHEITEDNKSTMDGNDAFIIHPYIVKKPDVSNLEEAELFSELMEFMVSVSGEIVRRVEEKKKELADLVDKIYYTSKKVST